MIIRCRARPVRLLQAFEDLAIRSRCPEASSRSAARFQQNQHRIQSSQRRRYAEGTVARETQSLQNEPLSLDDLDVDDYLPGDEEIPKVPSKVQRVKHHAEFLQRGVGDCFSVDGYDMGFKRYQQRMIDRIDDYIVGTDEEASRNNPLALCRKYYSDPRQADLYNHASMAQNQWHVFNTLSPEPTVMPKELKGEVEEAFGSVETLRTELYETANAMFGPGYVWLMRRHGINADLSILCTYGSQSPWPMPPPRSSPVPRGLPANEMERLRQPVNRPGTFSTGEAVDQNDPNNPFKLGQVSPILGVSLWQHVYVRDYLFDKSEYLRKWWKAVNWHEVETNRQLVISADAAAGLIHGKPNTRFASQITRAFRRSTY